MFEHPLQTRAAICGTGLLLGIIFFLAQLPLLLLIVPVAVLFLGIVADPEETHAVWYGMLNTFGIFDPAALTEEEKTTFTQKKHYFWFGEAGMAAILAGTFAVPAGIFLAGRAEVTLAFVSATTLFLLLFIFLPKLVRRAMSADPGAVIALFGKNEQVRKVFWTVFIAMAGLVLARIVDPGTAQQIAGILMGLGVFR